MLEYPQTWNYVLNQAFVFVCVNQPKFQQQILKKVRKVMKKTLMAALAAVLMLAGCSGNSGNNTTEANATVAETNTTQPTSALDQKIVFPASAWKLAATAVPQAETVSRTPKEQMDCTIAVLNSNGNVFHGSLQAKLRQARKIQPMTLSTPDGDVELKAGQTVWTDICGNKTTTPDYAAAATNIAAERDAAIVNAKQWHGAAVLQAEQIKELKAKAAWGATWFWLLMAVVVVGLVFLLVRSGWFKSDSSGSKDAPSENAAS